MINDLRTLSADLITRYLRRPRALVVRAWAWLCANTNDLDEKHRCLTAILELQPDLEWAQLALRQVRYRQAQMN
jgi:hypothetical protein